MELYYVTRYYIILYYAPVLLYPSICNYYVIPIVLYYITYPYFYTPLYNTYIICNYYVIHYRITYLYFFTLTEVMEAPGGWGGDTRTWSIQKSRLGKCPVVVVGSSIPLSRPNTINQGEMGDVLSKSLMAGLDDQSCPFVFLLHYYYYYYRTMLYYYYYYYD